MQAREMKFQGLVALGVVVGIVGGNFVMHRWMLGNATSRPADAGIHSGDSEATPRNVNNRNVNNSENEIDFSDLAPRRRDATSVKDAANRPARRESLAQRISQKFPDMPADEQAAWVDELESVSLETADGILELRRQVGSLRNVR